MIELIFLLTAFVGIMIAVVTDLRERRVPNRLSFSLIALGFGGHLIYGFYTSSFDTFFLALESFILMFVVGYALWALGGWSPGDAKMFMFLAVLLPQYPKSLLQMVPLKPALASYPFILTVLINTFAAFFPFAAVYSFYLSYLKVGISRFIQFPDPTRPIKNAFVLVGCASLSIFSRYLPILALLLLVVKFKTLHRLVISGAFVLIYMFYSGSVIPLIKYFLFLAVVLLVLNFLWNFMKIVRNEGLQSEIKITDLKEGMVVAEDFYEEGEKVIRDRRSIIEKVREAARARDFSILRKRKIVNTGSSGISEEEIGLLRRYVSEGKLEDSIRITKSIAFAPVVAFFGLILALLFGDVILKVREFL